MLESVKETAMNTNDLDCLIISNDNLTSDTEQYNLDRLNAGWHSFYGWQWAKIQNKCYSVDNFLNYVCQISSGSLDSRFDGDLFNHFAWILI